MEYYQYYYMSNIIKQTYRRDLTDTGQVTIPSEFRDDEIVAYLIQESTDNEGREHLKLYPITDYDDD
ncbi:MAG: hypothetical protein J07HQX50_01886 [Haloquadratum sp. J07HQX50]|nr:MAG: hypothetical protein J07HQX50_01886 [Haloquadratum sp. J07HQX50]